jgi:phenylalanyl-tRNA synthetase beta chain
VRFVPARIPALHPGRARASRSTARVGRVGELHPRWRQAYELPPAPVLFEIDLDALLARDVPQFRRSRHQSLARLAIVSASRDHSALMRHRRPDAAVRSAQLFDIYKPQSAATSRRRAQHGVRWNC